jgi:Ni,Fe-hydrogenase III component G
MNPERLDVNIDANNVTQAVEAIHNPRWGYLAAITGLDLGIESGKIEVLYQFAAGPEILTLRVTTPRAAPSVPSICAILPYASFFERELSEMFGVTVADTPDPSHLFLPDDWPDAVYPLRKDFVGKA